MTYTKLILDLLEAAKEEEGRARLFRFKLDDEFQAVRAEKRARLLSEAGSTLIAEQMAIVVLTREVEGLRSLKASVDQARNSGDGSYRP